MEEMKNLKIEQEYNGMMNRIGKVFANESGFRNAKNYIKGLMGSAERKNGWQLSEKIGESTPYKMQQFIYRGEYKADTIRDELRTYVGEKIGEQEGVMVVDDTGFIKQGKKSCGVQRQYSGTAGKICNCQIGVFLTYASCLGHSAIDRRLYIPKEWFKDAERRTEAGVPEELCVSAKETIHKEFKQIKVGKVLKNLPREGWFEASCGNGSKGARVYDWMLVEIESDWRPVLFGEVSEGWKRVMLVRRSKSDITDMQTYICYAPKETD